MKTPAGKECRYYYADFHRGRNRQECRLIRPSLWRPSDCHRCPVPDILWANASEHLQLEALVRGGFLGLGRHIQVRAFCALHHIEIEDPYIGCKECAAERPGWTGLTEQGDT